jgi:hypothetical protein
MGVLLFLAAAVLIWLGVDAVLLSWHSSPPTQIEKDEMMFGRAHRRPVSDTLRAFAERRYPFATAGSMRSYGALFIAAGLLTAWLAWKSWA